MEYRKITTKRAIRLFFYSNLIFLGKMRKICGNGRKTVSEIFREILRNQPHSYCTLNTAIKTLEEFGMVKCEKKGRVKYVWLTEEGKEIADCVLKILKILRVGVNMNAEKDKNVAEGEGV